MIIPGAAYLEQEALKTGAMPSIRATFYPYLWPVATNAQGEFSHTSFVAPDRILAEYIGFDLGYRTSPTVTSNAQVAGSPAVIDWVENNPGYNSVLFWVFRDYVDDVWSDWTPLTKGETVTIPNFYYFYWRLLGFRAWAEDAPGGADDFTAWAVDTAGVESEEGFADDAEIPGEVRTYLEQLTLTGEYSVVNDIEMAGNLTQEVPKVFDDLVAGSHSGLVLNNRQSVLVGSVVTPAPRYSPNKNTFFLFGQNWFGLKLRIEMGWTLGDWFAGEIFDDPFLVNRFTDYITLFEGKVTKWGPVSRGVGNPTTVEVFAKDWIMECLNQRVALPAEDGTPSPLTFGEFLCKGEQVSGWSPAPIVRAAYFEQPLPVYDELDSVIGNYRLVEPGITGTRAFQCETTGANQTSYGAISLGAAGEIFITGTMRFVAVEPTRGTSDRNFTFMQAVRANGTVAFSVKVDGNGFICATPDTGEGKFNIMAYIGVPLTFALWVNPITAGGINLWINGEEVLTYRGDISSWLPLGVRFGAITDSVAGNWKIDYDDIEVRTKYYQNAYQVTGGPFNSISQVYVDNIAQLDTETIGGYVKTLTRFPLYGMVQFTSTNPEFKPSGDVMIRVVEYAGGRHALEVIEALLAAAGVTDKIDAVALAAAYVACPQDIINARFDGGGERQAFGLKDVASVGVTIAGCLKEICARCMYWIFVDHGVIKIVPYTGAPPGTAIKPLDAGNLYEAMPTIDLDQLNTFITATFGWYARNPSLCYVAGTPAAGGLGRGLDYTWESPVACESLVMVKAKADMLLKFLSAQERLEPVRLNLEGARIELMDIVSVEDVVLSDAVENYYVTRKDVGLDPGSRETSLQLMRFLGE